VNYIVELSGAAQQDINELLEYLVPRAGTTIASNYVGRLRAFLEGFEAFPERGMRRDDISPGLRLVGFRRKATIAFRVQGDRVTILRIYHGGRNIEVADFEGT
jgi:plasmid stabilization system protein ParE